MTDINQQVAVWRQKAAEGTLTLDEMKEAIKLLRAGRESAASASDAARRKKARVEVKSADELLSELDGL